jgi:hypothetical protein
VFVIAVYYSSPTTKNLKILLCLDDGGASPPNLAISFHMKIITLAGYQMELEISIAD